MNDTIHDLMMNKYNYIIKNVKTVSFHKNVCNDLYSSDCEIITIIHINGTYIAINIYDINDYALLLENNSNIDMINKFYDMIISLTYGNKYVTFTNINNATIYVTNIYYINLSDNDNINNYIKCDLCKKTYDDVTWNDNVLMYTKKIISRNVKDINKIHTNEKIETYNICEKCSENPLGKYYINMYGLKKEKLINIRLYHTFGSIFDWMPITNYDKCNTYECKCINKKNIHYGMKCIIDNQICDKCEITIIYDR
jgi:hypothetical protein